MEVLIAILVDLALRLSRTNYRAKIQEISSLQDQVNWSFDVTDEITEKISSSQDTLENALENWFGLDRRIEALFSLDTIVHWFVMSLFILDRADSSIWPNCSCQDEHMTSSSIPKKNRRAPRPFTACMIQMRLSRGELLRIIEHLRFSHDLLESHRDRNWENVGESWELVRIKWFLKEYPSLSKEVDFYRRRGHCRR
jgi:hypothetical protein